MKVYPYPPRKCFRVMVPAELNEGKRQAKYFKTRTIANEYIAERTNRPASNMPVAVPQRDQVFLEDLVDSVGSRDEIWKAINHYKATVLSVIRKGTVFNMCEEFILWEQTQGFSKRTLSDDRYRVKRFALAFGNDKPAELIPSKIAAWVDTHTTGSNRRNMFKVAHKLLAWAERTGWIGVDVMKGLIKPKANSAKGIIPVGSFEQILRVCAGLKPLPQLPKNFKPRAGMNLINDFMPVLPVFVLGGMVGLRTSELVKMYQDDRTVQWEDIDWDDKFITVAHGVAKKTRRDSDLRYPLLCDAAIAWLEPIAKTSGPIVGLTDSVYREYRRQLCVRLGMHIPTNGLRNSFASYGQSFRTLGEVAKDMGDLEETARKHYMQTLKPNSGRAWFDIRPDAPAKIISMRG